VSRFARTALVWANLVDRTGDDDGFVDNGHDLSRFRKWFGRFVSG